MPQTQVIESPNPQAELDLVFAGVQQALDTADYTVPMMLISKEIERFEQRLFETEKAPNGTPWARNAQSTIRRKGHDVVLHQKGRLGTSLFQTTPDSIRDITDRFLVFGTDVPYSWFLNEGTKLMPAREHVGLDDAMCDLAAEYVADGAVVALGGTP